MPTFDSVRRHIIMLGILTVLWVLVGWRFWTPNLADRQVFLQNSDFTLHYYGPISQQIERFQAGEFAQWNPYNRAGFPQVANIQNGVFYPPRYVMASLMGGNGWTIEDFQWEVLLHVWLTSILMYAFVYRVFRQVIHARWIAVFGAIIWAYSGYLSSYPLLHITILETVTWLPLALLGMYLSMASPRWVWGIVLLCLSMMLMVFAGHPQVLLYCAYLTAFYGLYLGWSLELGWAVTLLRVIGGVGIGCGLAAVQLLPTLELMQLSSRVVEQGFDEKSLGFGLTAFLSLMWSSGAGVWSPLYVGAVTIFLAVAALSQPLRKPIFWLCVVGAGLFFTFGGHTIIYEAAYVFLPGVSIFRNQERAVLVVILGLVMLACHGLAWLTTTQQPIDVGRFGRMSFGLLGGIGTVFIIAQIIILAGTPIPTIDGLALTLLVSGGFVLWLSYQGHRSVVGRGFLIGLVCLDLLTIVVASPSRVRDAPEHDVYLDPTLMPYRVTDPTEVYWRIDGSGGIQGTADYFRLPDMYGNGPLSLESIDKLYTLPVDRFWEIFSVRYATITNPPPAEVDLNLIAYGRNASGGEFQVVELVDPRPLAHLVYDYRMSQGSAEFARQIMADSNINLREQAITLYPLPFELPVTRPEISAVSNVQWVTPERLNLNVSTGADALLTFSVVNYPGWKVLVNQQSVEIVDVYAGLIGVPLRAGENQQIELFFESDTLRMGGILSLILLTALVGLIVFWGRNK